MIMLTHRKVKSDELGAEAYVRFLTNRRKVSSFL